MFKSGFALVLTVFLQIANSQGPPAIPEKCKKPPPIGVKPLDCCDLPQLFRDEDFDACGFDRAPPPKDALTSNDCTRDICMLKRFDLLNDDNSIKYDAVAQFLDKHSEDKPNLKDAFTVAKERCVSGKLIGPPQLCDHHKLIRCLTGTLFSECPTWQKSEGCKALKVVIDECRKFFEQYSF